MAEGKFQLTSAAVAEKMTRLSRGESPRILDLFAGCGGLSLGFHRAGCTSIGGVEIDRHAARSYAENFHKHADPESFKYHARSKDITSLEPSAFLKQLGYEEPRTSVDMIIGGPPCPAFTRVGRAKLREVHRHPEAFKQDPRWKLYIPYLEFVDELQPLVVLMENVPDMMNFGGQNLAEDICDTLEDSGYRCAYTLLNSANFGVPQMRERMILIGLHEILKIEPSFPRPTHSVDFPAGYLGSRDVALKPLKEMTLFDSEPRYIPIPEQDAELPGPVTVREAINDLPIITGHLTGDIKRGARRFDKPLKYSNRPPSEYAKEMRTWPHFESDGELWDHVIRSLSDRDFRLFRHMKPGDDYPVAHELAKRLFQRALEKQVAKTGRDLVQGTTEYQALESRYVPPYDPGKFPNKWRKMEPEEPARTLMAHLGKDSYSHIHYDDDQARTLSVREAARLQSFPDGFRFSGTMNPAFRQIGNAVPPLFAYALARHIQAELDLACRETNKNAICRPELLPEGERTEFAEAVA